MQFTVDVGIVAGSLITAAVIGAIGLLLKGNSTIAQISRDIGSNHPPEGMLGRIVRLEIELTEMRDWAIRAGYDRRKHDVEK